MVSVWFMGAMVAVALIVGLVCGMTLMDGVESEEE